MENPEKLSQFTLLTLRGGLRGRARGRNLICQSRCGVKNEARDDGASSNPFFGSDLQFCVLAFCIIFRKQGGPQCGLSLHTKAFSMLFFPLASLFRMQCLCMYISEGQSFRPLQNVPERVRIFRLAFADGARVSKLFASATRGKRERARAKRERMATSNFSLLHEWPSRLQQKVRILEYKHGETSPLSAAFFREQPCRKCFPLAPFSSRGDFAYAGSSLEEGLLHASRIANKKMARRRRRRLLQIPIFPEGKEAGSLGFPLREALACWL